MRLLIIEDDLRVSAAMRSGLIRHGFDVLSASAPSQGYDALAAGPDMVLLDLGLPDLDGFRVCARIRELSSVPIIIVTGRDDIRSRAHGLNLGADDYIVKPVRLPELIARIHAVARRIRPQAGHEDAHQPSEVFRVLYPHGATLVVDGRRRTVLVNGTPVSLTRKEFDLIGLMAGQPGIVFRRDQIISAVWSTLAKGVDRTLEVHVASLRKKLGVPGLIETVHGIGYRLAH